ncbi:MAG: class I SAM-dependent methyltransferase [Planctomycetota bacterium]
MAEPWFVEAFRAEYLDVYPHRDLESAQKEAGYLVERGLAGRVLDLCCGSGRHCIALRERGIDAFGLDLSLDLLRRARGLDGRIVCGDARSIPCAPGSLDAVVSLFSSFGYFGDEGDRLVLLEVSRVLKPRGLFVIDLMNPTRVRAELVPSSEAVRGRHRIVERRSLADDGRRVVKEVRFQTADGSSRAWREDVRLYEVRDLLALLTGTGLEMLRADGGYDGSTLSPDSSRQILWLRRC